MHILVVDDVVPAGNILVETNDPVLFLPTVLEKAGRLGTSTLPKAGGHSFHGIFIARGKDEKRCAGLETHLGETRSKDGAHLLELAGNAAAVIGAAVGKDAEVRAAHLDPGFFSGETGGWNDA
jgi:hypothetical protein